MLPYVVVWFLLITPNSGGWVKVANFYSHPHYDPVLTPLGKTEDDLLVLAVDTVRSLFKYFPFSNVFTARNVKDL